MDIVTQGLIGATAAQAGARPNEVRLASLVGFCAPLLADADAFIRSANDSLLHLEYHRHFTHSLLFIPVGALLASLLFWPLLRKRLAFKRIYLYAFFGYATAGILDACTSYGTHLLWPFSNDQIAWSIISIIDPVFSLALIIAIVVGIIKNQQLAARAGMVFVAAYLSIGVIQQRRAESLTHLQAQQRGHTIERLIVKPTICNLLLWRSVYEADGMYYVNAVRVGLPGNSKVYPGDKIEAFDFNRDLPQLTDGMKVHRDIERFELFSDGYLAWHPEHPNVLGDVRYAMLPTSVRPLWGIELHLEAPDAHVQFDTYRDMSDTEREAFLAMLLNN
ncbi:metal-dependent hydrolase [Rubellicoccus peritrichatus]|uniref:Metal-dependent hydrolase n=1 Tax=Rubellicoccus peritrichatus TaxID=3080537 RepID=A0AAQ3L8Y5_9BACT|nr:metal-dependent hydrolase [Puniceicoccus sp. CR14]WOO41021.1 metal-dependent hydrolase [Puniceicoccus sp. CR14]